MTPVRLAAASAVLAAAVPLSACTSSGADSGESPEEVLASAKDTLDETSGVHVVLSAEKLPKMVDGILRADGIGTHDPAFKGDLKVVTGGIAADVPVVAAQGKVFAKLPFTTRFVEVDPAAYAAPDPAGLMEPEGGLSSLLTAAEDVEEGERVRSGKDVLASYSGTVPGDVVASIIPSASADTDFEARFTVDDEDQVHQVVLTGPFYPRAADVTYTVTFDQYDSTADITLP